MNASKQREELSKELREIWKYKAKIMSLRKSVLLRITILRLLKSAGIK